MSRFGDTEPFSALQREMNRMFDDAWRGFGVPMLTGGSTSNWPSLGFSENETGYTVTAEVPGLEEKDIDLSVVNDVLTLKGEKKTTTEDPSKHFSEHFYGSFQRRISLPNDIDRDRVSASFKNGVLTVTLPKAPEAQKQSKRIEIKKA
jgi:HSP20 family protein